MDLELKALENLQNQYKLAIENNASFSKIMDIRNRLDVVKQLIIDNVLENMKKAG